MAESNLHESRASRRQTADIDELDHLRDVVRGVDLTFHQLGPGRLRTTLTRVTLGPVTFDAARYSLPLSAAGRAGRDTASFVLGAVAVYNGFSLSADDLIVFPPGSEYEGLSKGPVSDFIFTVRPEDLSAFAAAAGIDFAAENLRRVRRLDCPRELTRRLLRIAEALERDGGLAAYGGPAGEAALTHEVMATLCAALTSARNDAEAARTECRAKLIRAVDKLVATSSEHRVSVAALCRTLGVTQRKLQKAFHAILGIGPCEYDRIRRLHAARRELREHGTKHRPTVTDVGLRHGFEHFGRFSRYYREFFDELPSETLRLGRRQIEGGPAHSG